MKNGLAIWHYPHRTLTENVRWFSKTLDSVSALGFHFVEVCRADGGAALAEALRENNPIFTVHHKLPSDHGTEAVEAFKEDIALCAAWQKQYGLLATLSFDVPRGIRDNILPYLTLTLDAFAGEKTRIAIEDFGLTQDELSQLEPLKGNRQFGFLIDIGHLSLRLRNETHPGSIQFCFSGVECPGEKPDANAGREMFYKALASKPFPIYEMHLHNNDGRDDLHWFLEDGVLDIQMMADVLTELGYDDVLTIESAPGFKFKCAGQAADDGIARTIAYWKDCLAKAAK